MRLVLCPGALKRTRPTAERLGALQKQAWRPPSCWSRPCSCPRSASSPARPRPRHRARAGTSTTTTFHGLTSTTPSSSGTRSCSTSIRKHPPARRARRSPPAPSACCTPPPTTPGRPTTRSPRAPGWAAAATPADRAHRGQQEKAISYAAYRVLTDLFPNRLHAEHGRRGPRRPDAPPGLRPRRHLDRHRPRRPGHRQHGRPGGAGLPPPRRLQPARRRARQHGRARTPTTTGYTTPRTSGTA